MGQVFAIVNQKGGVGKTTTSINLAASLAKLERRVLLIDIDPQGNATMGSGVEKSELEQSANEVLLGDANISAVLHSTESGYDLLPTNRHLTEASVRLLQMARSEFQLRDALSQIRDKYDFILIDCPPSLNALTLNALVAADGVMIPLQCEYYSLEGLSSLIETVSQIQEDLNPDLIIEGLLRTMYDGRNRLTLDVSEQLIEHFGDKVYNTVIPRNVRLAEAPGFGVAALFYDRQSPGAQAYLQLAEEVLTKQVYQQEQPHAATEPREERVNGD